MTRFARAKGSKASNERVPEEATPWSEMKQQLFDKNKQAEESVLKQEADNKREKNYRAFLESVEEEKRQNTSWAEFPPGKNLTTKRKLPSVAAPEQAKALKVASGDDNNKADPSEKKTANKTKKLKKGKKPANEAKANANDSGGKFGRIRKSPGPKPKKPGSASSNVPKKPKEELTEAELKKVEKKKEKKIRQLEKRKQIKTTPSPAKKLNAKKPSERRNKPQQPSMIIHGKEVPMAYVDGFPIKKEDAERIHLLRQQMISKGLPRSEIEIALKLERRKSEKAFTRERKKVCFNCRKSGHNLSECPELVKDMVQSTGCGICFKCGSTEHTHFECKVVSGQEFKFAKCFVCQEQGHIARQCPDNARGLYPKGGACRVCGDVTHLKKDCPKFQAQQMQLEQSVRLGILDKEDNPDNLDTNEDTRKQHIAKTPNKIIKF